ncbi:MAG: non-hydrolyzing UDP-N-acetylglucosamine 2-epimerase [Saprospiraceae bacterium]
MKVVSIVGARPQFIKSVVLSEQVRRSHEEVLVHTGQHFDGNMSSIFFEELGIPKPDVYLGISGGSHGEQTGRMLVEIEKVLMREKPDWCVVYGDTNSTLAGALAAAKLQVRVAHVEAGLRSFNRSMPEEINRVASDHMSELLFCPTAHAAALLRGEGITAGVHVVGDIMADVLFRFLPRAKQSQILNRLGVSPREYALVTLHRPYNTDDPAKLTSLLETIAKIGMKAVFPMHPRTQGMVRTHQIPVPANISVIDPVGYLDILQLQSHADVILTDSGGMQKEAYWLGVRCITLRTETEWVETVEAGWNQVVGSDPQRILDAVRNWRPQGNRPDIYGDGHTAARIFDTILEQSKHAN